MRNLKLAVIHGFITVMVWIAIQPPADPSHLLAMIALGIPATCAWLLIIEAFRIIVLDRGRR